MMYKKEFLRSFKNELKNNKAKFIIYFLLRTLIILCLILQIIRKDFENVALCFLSLILLFLPFLIERRLKVDLPNTLEIIIMLFVFSAEINNFYEIIPFWDTILHTLNGFVMAAIGFSLFDILNDKIKSIHLSPIFLCLFSFCFSMTIGIIWEFFEYGMDKIVNFDMQKDEYINKINTVTLDPEKNNNVITINNIKYTIIYDQNNNEIVKLNGYLDIGLNDTMKDLIVNFIGAIIFNIFGFLYLKNRDKDIVVKNFIITNKKIKA